MNCTSCGANLPPGAASCPVCNNPTPYNVSGQGSSPQIDPTMIAPRYGNPPSGPDNNPPPIDPTVVASPYGAPPPSTAYDAPPPYGGSSTPPNPYESSNPYGAPPPPQNSYNPPPLAQGGYGSPSQPGIYGAPPQPGGYGTQPPKKRSRVGMIIGIVLLVLLLACVGISFAVYQGLKTGVNSVLSSAQSTATAAVATVTAGTNDTPTTGTTPTTSTGQGAAPSGLSIDPTAAGYITNGQMASAIDANYNPTTLSSTFKVNQLIYATFKVADSAPAGFITGKWYSNGTYAFSSDPLTSNGGGGPGYLSAKYNIATQGTVEFYWCTTKTCSDGKLASFVNFTVTSTGLHWMMPPTIGFMDINRPE